MLHIIICGASFSDHVKANLDKADENNDGILSHDEFVNLVDLVVDEHMEETKGTELHPHPIHIDDGKILIKIMMAILILIPNAIMTMHCIVHINGCSNRRLLLNMSGIHIQWRIEFIQNDLNHLKRVY